MRFTAGTSLAFNTDSSLRSLEITSMINCLNILSSFQQYEYDLLQYLILFKNYEYDLLKHLILFKYYEYDLLTCVVHRRFILFRYCEYDFLMYGFLGHLILIKYCKYVCIPLTSNFASHRECTHCCMIIVTRETGKMTARLFNFCYVEL